MNRYIIDIHHGLGDIIHMIPVILAIRSSNCDTHIALIVSKPYIKDFIYAQGLADEVFVLNSKKDLMSLLKRKYMFYDYGIVAPCIGNVGLSAKILRFMGAKKIVFESPDSDLKTSHRVDRNIAVAGKLGIKVNNRYPIICLDDNSKEYCKTIVKKLDSKKTVGICIGGNPEKYKHDGIVEMVDVKRWPIKYYRELISKLCKNYNVLLLGGAADAAEFWNEFQPSDFDGNVIDLLGKTTVMQSAAAISCCDIIAGNDTGMIHVGAALGKVTIAVYCSTDPKKIGAYSRNAINIDKPLECKYCYLSKKTFECADKRCLHLVTPDEFYDQIVSALDIGEKNEVIH